MNCSDIKNQCHSYLDKQLNAAICQEVDAHLQVCPCCQKAYESQRAFLMVLKRLTQNCGFAAPEQLRGRISESLTNGGEHIEFKPLKRPAVLPHMGWLIGLAATIMFGFGAILATQMFGHVCPIVVAAEREHEKIVSGEHTFLAKDSDPQNLLAAIQKTHPEFTSVPNLAKYDLTPTQCGLVKLADLPEGRLRPVRLPWWWRTADADDGQDAVNVAGAGCRRKSDSQVSLGCPRSAFGLLLALPEIRTALCDGHPPPARRFAGNRGIRQQLIKRNTVQRFFDRLSR